MKLSTDLHEGDVRLLRASVSDESLRRGELRRPRTAGLRTRRLETDALADVRVRECNYRRLLAVSDVVSASVAVAFALGLLGGDRVRPGYVGAMVLVVLGAKLQGLYDRDELVIAKSTLDELPRLFNLATLLALVVWLSRHLVVAGAPTTQDLLLLWALLLAGLAGGRMLARRVAALERHPSSAACCSGRSASTIAWPRGLPTSGT